MRLWSAKRGGAGCRGDALLALPVAFFLLDQTVAQVVESRSPPPITVRVADELGQPLAEGTELMATTWTFRDPAGNSNWFASGIGPLPAPVVVGADGTVRLTPRTSLHGGIDWLMLQRPTTSGRGPRALVPWRELPERVTLVAECRLAAGAVVDEAGAAVPHWAPMLGVVGDDPSGVPARQLLDPRWVNGNGRYELWGWQAEGPFWLTATYANHGPSGPRTPLVFGAADLDLTLPTTGHVQVQLTTPKPFPERGAAFAVLRDVDRGTVQRHFLIPGDATNIRTRVGRFAVTLELNGIIVHDAGTRTVEHNRQTEVRHDLRQTVRVFLVAVVDHEGRPELRARVRVVGSPDEPMARQRVAHDGRDRSVFVVATTLAQVDLEVFRFGGTQVVVVEGVDGDRTIELPAEPR